MKKELTIAILLVLFLYKINAVEHAPADSFTIHNLGHSSLMIEYNNLIIHIDPRSSEANYDLLPDADLILISHGHSDHYDVNALNKIKKTGTKLICTQEVKNKNTYTGTIYVMNNGDSLKINDIPIKAVPAYNIVNSTNHPKGIGNGYLLSIGEKRIYIAGDTENIPEMSTFGKVDYAFLPMNLPYTMTPEMAADAAKKVKPDVLYIYHFGTSDTAKVRTLLIAEKMKIRIGESVIKESAFSIPSSLPNLVSREFLIGPNPVINELQFISTEENSTILIYNNQGQLIKKQEFNGSGLHNLNLTYLQTGYYVVCLSNKKESVKTAIIKR